MKGKSITKINFSGKLGPSPDITQLPGPRMPLTGSTLGQAFRPGIKFEETSHLSQQCRRSNMHCSPSD